MDSVICAFALALIAFPPQHAARIDPIVSDVRGIVHIKTGWIDDLPARNREGAKILRDHLAFGNGTLEQMRLLAKCDYAANQYAACVSDCDRVLAAHRSDRAATVLRREAMARKEAIAGARDFLDGEQAIQAEPLDRGQWVVLSDGTRLLRLVRRGRRWSLLQAEWGNGPNGGGVLTESGPGYLLRVNRKCHSPEVAVVRYLGDTSGGESCDLQVWQFRHGRLKWAGELPSNDCIFVGDLDHDGRLEFQNTHEIGAEMCHAEQPRWNDVYALRGGRLVEVDSAHPKVFAPWIGILTESLETYPDDLDLWAYYGKVQQILGRKASARAAFSHIAALARRHLRHPDIDVRSDLKERIRKLESYARQHRHFPKVADPFWASET